MILSNLVIVLLNVFAHQFGCRNNVHCPKSRHLLMPRTINDLTIMRFALRYLLWLRGVLNWIRNAEELSTTSLTRVTSIPS